MNHNYEKALKQIKGHVSIITDKNEIERLAEIYLKQNSLIDLTSFIFNDMGYVEAPSSFIRDVAYQMKVSGKYELQEKNERFYLHKIPKKHFKERYWWLIGILGYLGATVLNPIIQKRVLPLLLPESTQSSKTNRLSVDSSKIKGLFQKVCKLLDRDFTG